MSPKRLFGLDTLRGNLRLFSFLLAMLPLALATTVFSLFERERILRTEQETLQNSLRHDKIVTRSWLDSRLGDVVFLAGLDAARRGDREALETLFEQFTRSHRYVTSVVAVNAEGVTTADNSQPAGVYVGDRDYFQEARQGRPAVSGVLVSRASGLPLCIVAAPVTDPEGRFGGALFMPVEMASLDLLLGETVHDRSGSVMLTDEEGRILAPVRPIPADQAQWPKVSPEVLKGGEKGAIYPGPGGREMLGASIPLDVRGWRLVREIPTEVVLAGYWRQTLWVAAGALTTILLITPLLLRLCRNLERPMVTLSRYARELRHSNYDLACTPGEVSGMPLEMRELFEAFCTMAAEVRAHIEETERLSIQDHLTGLYNRRFLFAGGTKLLEAAMRAKRPCACLVIDVDHFKDVNDTYGHQVGDQILAHLAGVVQGGVRKADLVARYGGEEFVVLLTGAGLRQGRELAERLRRFLADTPCRINGLSLPVTVSIGVAEARQEVEFGAGMLDDLLARADRAMYAAKTTGRDRVMVEG